MSDSAQGPRSDPQLAIWKAIIVGWLVVNIPVIVIMLSSLFVGFATEPKVWWLFFSVGFIFGWMWWSHSVPRWRQWATQRGADPDRLQRWAVIAGLVWRKGSVFEKTETSLKD